MKEDSDVRLNVPFIKSVVTFWDEMSRSGLNLVYMGQFNQDITRMFTKLAESDMDRNSAKRSIKKKFFHVMVETLQNLHKHSDEQSAGIEGDGYDMIGNGMFMIGKKNETHYIISANNVSQKKCKDLQKAVDHVNQSSKEELREMYKNQLKDGSLSERGGAGLGLIDIARKTGAKIEYQFLPSEKAQMLFIMKVEVK